MLIIYGEAKTSNHTPNLTFKLQILLEIPHPGKTEFLLVVYIWEDPAKKHNE